MKTKEDLLKDLKVLREFNKELGNLSKLLDKKGSGQE